MPRTLAVYLVLVPTIALGACSGSKSPAAPTTSPPATPAPPAPPAVASMLQELASFIAWAIDQNQSLLPLNPHVTAQLQAKIAMLQSPTLADDIVRNQYYAEGSVASTNGRRLAVPIVFPAAQMRAEAQDAVRAIEQALPVLESFMAMPYPAGSVRVWYGFILGNKGGGGTLYMEDRATYESRTGLGALPYEAILDHELSHTYISHEGLNQFLELYVYNVVHTGTTDVQAWIFTRDYVAWSASNAGLAAILDVYQLIGHDAMARAYKALYGLRPPYGQPLSAECQQVFVDQAPDDLKAAVAAKMAAVTY